MALFVALGFVTSLATAALALSGGPYIDPTLAAIDRALFPFVDWRDMALALPAYPRLQAIRSQAYVALNWQGFLFLAYAAVLGTRDDMDELLSALTLGALICILPFPWLAALGPYPHFGLGPGDISGAAVGLPWQSPGKMEGLRDGTIQSLNSEVLSGLVTFPSFHACGAVTMAWAFWRYRLLRWPMLAINVTMFVAAVPIGGHYFVDMIAGGAAAALSIVAMRAIERWYAAVRGKADHVSAPPLPA